MTLLAVLPLVGCSGGSSAPPPVPMVMDAAFAESGTPSTPGLVRLTGTSIGDIVRVRVVLAGETTTEDLFGFAFDLVLGDASVAQYVDGSATLGTVLEFDVGQTGEAVAAQNGDRVTVGVSKIGGGDGNGLGDEEATVVRLDFRLLAIGETTLRIAGTPPNAAAAVGSDDAVLPSIAFDADPALLIGS